jgi:hypothetical protein
MATAVATRPKPRTKAESATMHGFRSPDEMREVIERTLEAVDRSARAGSALRAAGLSMRLELSDLNAVVTLRASDDPGHYIQWRFDRRGKSKPRLVLKMDSEVANAWLQGRESLALAIARRRAKCLGSARDALRLLPALKVISHAYRKLVRSDYPHLAI